MRRLGQKNLFPSKVIYSTADKHNRNEVKAMMAIVIQEGGILNAYRSVQSGTADVSD